MSHAPSNAPECTLPVRITYRIESAVSVVTGEGFVDSAALEAVLQAELPADRAWRVLLDVTHLRLTGGTQSLGVLSQFLQGDRPYSYRTAIIGLGSSTRRVLLNRSAALAPQQHPSLRRARRCVGVAVGWRGCEQH